MEQDKFKSMSLEDLAQGMRDRIHLYEQWINRHKRRAVTLLETDKCSLKLDKVSKSWIIKHKRAASDDEWQPLQAANLTAKMLALYMLPSLTAAMLEAHDKMLADFHQAIQVFDAWAETEGVGNTGNV